MVATTEVVINDKEVQRALKRAIRKIKNPTALFQTIEGSMFRDVMDHFRKEVGPNRKKWKGLKLETLIARAKKRKVPSAGILKDTGRLRNSIRGKSGRRFAEVGTNLVYAATHDFGDPSRNIPKREFMYLSEKAVRLIVDKIIPDAIEKAFRGV